MLEFIVVLILFFLGRCEVPKQPDYAINMRKGRCEFNEFDCFPAELFPYCVPFEVVRDCIPDCPNGEDEKCGFNQTLCDVSVKRSNSMCGKCVNNIDLNRFCVDRKWQNLCSEENVRQCATTRNCVHESWLNDGEDDCGDASDEAKCPTERCRQNNSSRPLIDHLHKTTNFPYPYQYQNRSQPMEEHEFPCDCADLMLKNPKTNMTSIQKAYDPRCYKAGQCPFSILCDFELFGGGWTVIMHRQWPSQIHFNRTWTDYRLGFGILKSGNEFWIGNDRLHGLTFGRKCSNELVIRMKTARQGSTILARYETIVVGDESNAYKLALGPLLAENPLFTPIDELLATRDRPFVTWDRQQHYCAENSGGWWLTPDDCGLRALTSKLEASKKHPGITWAGQRLVEITMLIRPRFYTPPISG